MSEEHAHDSTPTIRKFGQALAAVHGVKKGKTADVGSYSYRYVDLGTVLDAVKQACSDHGLAISQYVRPVTEDGTRQQMVTTLVDVSTGQILEFGGPVWPVSGDPQAMGSALTYYRRYSLVTLFAMNTDDDDGAQANRQATRPQERTEAEKEVRHLISKMQDDEKADYMGAFKDEFHSTLTSLPESRHGDALAFTKRWISDIAPEVLAEAGVDEV